MKTHSQSVTPGLENVEFLFGCSGLDPSEYEQEALLPELSEVDLLAYSSWSSQERRILGLRIAQGHQVVGSCSSAWISRGDPLEKKMILEELCAELRISKLIVRVQARHVNWNWPHYSFVELGLDFPQEQRGSPVLSRSEQRVIQSVWDPMWDSEVPTHPNIPRFVKIHGWHESRWIRRYGTDQIREGMKKLRGAVSLSRQTILILLAHSQKRQQLSEFRDILNK